MGEVPRIPKIPLTHFWPNATKTGFDKLVKDMTISSAFSRCGITSPSFSSTHESLLIAHIMFVLVSNEYHDQSQVSQIDSRSDQKGKLISCLPLQYCLQSFCTWSLGCPWWTWYCRPSKSFWDKKVWPTKGDGGGNWGQPIQAAGFPAVNTSAKKMSNNLPLFNKISSPPQNKVMKISRLDVHSNHRCT